MVFGPSCIFIFFFRILLFLIYFIRPKVYFWKKFYMLYNCFQNKTFVEFFFTNYNFLNFLYVLCFFFLLIFEKGFLFMQKIC